MRDIFFKLMLSILQKLHEIDNNAPFLPERMKIEKLVKPLPNLHDKTEYFMHMRHLKQALNQGLFFKIFHRVIKFNQNSWLKSHSDMTTDLRKKTKTDFEKDFFKFINNAALEKHTEVKL